MSKSSKKLSTSLFILMGLLFAFSFDSLLKDIVYAAGFIIAIVLIFLYRTQAKQEKE